MVQKMLAWRGDIQLTDIDSKLLLVNLWHVQHEALSLPREFRGCFLDGYLPLPDLPIDNVVSHCVCECGGLVLH
jgi:hypothetical protein